jgi:hypothetical protein
VGQAKIVNAERLSGPPTTIELTNVTEGQALDVLLRTVAGYMAAPRATPVANGSLFDRILILPTSTPPRASASTPAPAFAPPPPQFTPALPDDDDDDPRPPTPGPRGPIFNTFPQPGQTAPMPAGAPANFPFNGAPGQPTRAPGNVPAGAPGAPPVGSQMPVGVSVPGMIVPQPPPVPNPQ